MRLLDLKKTRALRDLMRDESGHFAVITALIGLPLVVAVGLAVDTSNSFSYKDHVKTALDTASLAAVIPANLSDEERKAFATKVFNENYTAQKNTTIKIDVTATRERVDMSAKANLPTYLGGIVGQEEFNVGAESAAVLTRSDVICLFALDPIGERSLEFTDSAQFSAPACSVQSNSTHPQALYSDTLTMPKAKSFCSSGGSAGDYYPYVKNNCTPVKDPFESLQIPVAGKSCDSSRQVVLWGENALGAGRAFLESELTKTQEGDSIIPDFSTMSPGIYCRGIQINGANVRLEPGVYHVWGDLEFTQNAGVVGDGVTFILKGTGNRLLINEGAEVSLRAPQTGLTKGLVFWQKYLQFRPYLRGDIPDSPEKVIATSEISSGGGLKIIGTAYLPDHELVISSANSVASQSPATSFIARRIRLEGKANIHLRVDHQEGGVPPILPRSDDSARLVK
ncbi:MAG: TadE/TadG family type IV pilus assembly protein [Hellea sp.]